MKRILLFAVISISVSVKAQNNLNLVPMPAEVKTSKGNLIIRQPIGFIVNDAIEPGDGGIRLFKDFLKRKYGFTKFKDGDTHSYGLLTEIFIDFDGENKSAGYEIDVTGKDITIRGNAQGIFYAFETLKQLINKDNKKQIVIPVCTIKDYPRFNYRGMHLDVCRHFMPVDLVKKYIDYLAMYKFNTFHWHLTEDQGWRIEIKKYPKLTQVGGWRNGTIIGGYPGTGNDSIKHGGYYTQEQIKDVIKYAADRYITIIPEIELPGHSSAAIAAYPELSCFPDEDTKYPAECVWAGPAKGKHVQQTWGVFEDVFCPSEYTFKFLEDVLDEVIQLFPSKYIHIGGDECPKDAWKRSDFCQQLIKEKGLKDEHELQSHFIQRIEKYINSKGKKIIGWDEILEGGLAPNATVMSWRGEAGGIAAAKQHHDVIMTPEYPLYLNHSQTKNEDSVTQGGYNPLDAVYNYEPIPKELTEEEGKYVLGAQGNVWSEYIDSKSKLEYSVFPRMAALAEVLWTPKEKRNWKDFERRLPWIMEQLDKEKINYSKAYYELETKVLPTKDFDGVLWHVKTKIDNCFLQILETKENFGLYDSTVVFLHDTPEQGMSEIKYIITKREFDTTAAETNYLIKTNGVTTAGVHLPFNFLAAGALNKKTKKVFQQTKQGFHFNKATGKKITLTYPADEKYPGDGAFTLVNGVQNYAGLSKSSEFLGFNGKDCEAIIDFGKTDSISKVIIHALHQTGDWIWKPLAAEVFTSNDGINFKPVGITNDFIKTNGANGTMSVSFDKTNTRFLKILIRNWGIIPAGNSGSGSAAWLFVDEIEVE